MPLSFPQHHKFLFLKVCPIHPPLLPPYTIVIPMAVAAQSFLLKRPWLPLASNLFPPGLTRQENSRLPLCLFPLFRLSGFFFSSDHAHGKRPGGYVSPPVMRKLTVGFLTTPTARRITHCKCRKKTIALQVCWPPPSPFRLLSALFPPQYTFPIISITSTTPPFFIIDSLFF